MVRWLTLCSQVYVSSRSAKDCDKTASELTALGPGTCISLPANLQSVQEIQRLVSELKSREQVLDVLINNAGAAWGESAGACGAAGAGASASGDGGLMSRPNSSFPAVLAAAGTFGGRRSGLRARSWGGLCGRCPFLATGLRDRLCGFLPCGGASHRLFRCGSRSPPRPRPRPLKPPRGPPLKSPLLGSLRGSPLG